MKNVFSCHNRVLFLACLILICQTGCTGQRLRNGLVNQASTLTDLQYRQILGNLAMMSIDPWALPTHANIRDGSTQIQDFGQATVSGMLTRTSQAQPLLSGSRTVVEQWGMEPVTEKVELKLMRVAYRRALGYGDTLENGLANDIAHEICKQISNSDDIDLKSDTLLNTKITESLLTPMDSEYQTFANQQIVESKNNVPLATYWGLADEQAILLSEIVNKTAKKFSDLRINSNDKYIIFDPPYDDLKTLGKHLVSVGNLPREEFLEKIPGYDEEQGSYHTNRQSFRDLQKDHFVKFSTPITHEARRQVAEIYDDIDKINPGWFGVGTKHDLPKNAIYVGRYCDRYAWVCGDGCEQLADFTTKIIDFASIVKPQTVLTVPGGPRFTPSSGSR